MVLPTRSRRCRFFCPIDRLPCKLPFAGVVVKIRIREDRTFGGVDRIPTRTAALKNASARSRTQSRHKLAKTWLLVVTDHADKSWFLVCSGSWTGRAGNATVADLSWAKNVSRSSPNTPRMAHTIFPNLKSFSNFPTV